MNIYDIAKEAGVSISTVSRVMNNKGNVNADYKKKSRSKYWTSMIIRPVRLRVVW